MGKPFFRYEYTGFHGCDSTCNLEVYNNLVICSERGDNEGTSITNMAEHLATETISKQFDITARELIWVEHYPATRDDRGDEQHAERWSLVFFNLTGGGFFSADETDFAFSNPRWVSIDPKVVLALIETHQK